MTGWAFTYGVDGFGQDVAPANEEGIYLSFNKAFARLCELNEKAVKGTYWENENMRKFCEKNCINENPPIGLYAIEEVEIIE
jgi:hypothetical protein